MLMCLRFLNGIYVYNVSSDNMTIANSNCIDDEYILQRYSQKGVFFENIFSTEDFREVITTIEPVNYVKKVKQEKINSPITKETYQKLNDIYKEKYEESKQKEETKKYNKLEVLPCLETPIIYYPLEKEKLSIGIGYINPEGRAEMTYPNELLHLFPCYLSSKKVFEYLTTLLKEKKELVKKDRIINIRAYEIEIKFLEHDYTGDMKKVEIKNRKGRSYATPKYEYVKDMPKTLFSKVILEKDCIEIYGKDYLDLEEQLDNLVNQIIKGGKIYV